MAMTLGAGRGNGRVEARIDAPGGIEREVRGMSAGMLAEWFVNLGAAQRVPGFGKGIGLLFVVWVPRGAGGLERAAGCRSVNGVRHRWRFAHFFGGARWRGR